MNLLDAAIADGDVTVHGFTDWRVEPDHPSFPRTAPALAFVLRPVTAEGQALLDQAAACIDRRLAAAAPAEEPSTGGPYDFDFTPPPRRATAGARLAE